MISSGSPNGARVRLAAVSLALALAVLPACNPQPIVVNALLGLSLAPGQTLALGTLRVDQLGS